MRTPAQAREMLREHMRANGYSEAEIAYRTREDTPQWPEPTLEGLRQEAAKWPERITDFAIIDEPDRLRVSLKRNGVEWVSEMRLTDMYSQAGRARERLMSDFCTRQLAEIERLGNPRWDALVAEEQQR